MDAVNHFRITSVTEQLLAIFHKISVTKELQLFLLFFSLIIGLAIFLFFLNPRDPSVETMPKEEKETMVSYGTGISPPNAVLCPQMDCIRCHRSNETKQRALYLFDHYYGNEDKEAVSRIQDAFINQVEPYIFYVNGLQRQPIWRSWDFPPYICKDMDIIFQQLRHFRQEYKTIKMFSANNAVNNWSTYSFLNQGDWMPSTAESKPTRILRPLNCLMEGCLFGNAFLSVLKPGTDIEPHFGPTNVRIRCHLPIQLPLNLVDAVRCSIFVDGALYEWKDGHWLIFDDSFLHSVRYYCNEVTGKQMDDRCVLVLDLWHPDLTKEEIECIKKIFPSRLTDSLW